MTNPVESAFLAAVAAGDETARLAFADWLEEQGDVRGSWVRDPDIWPYMAPDATDPVPRLLEGTDGKIPDKNWCLLRRIGAAAVPSLVALVQDGEKCARYHAAWTLGWIREDAVVAVPALVAALQDENVRVRRASAGALVRIGAVEAVPALIDALRDEDKWVRFEAARALGAIGPGSAVAVPTLTGTLRDEDAEVRFEADR